MAVAVISAIVIASWSHGLGYESACVALSMGFLMGGIVWVYTPKITISPPKTFWDWGMIVVFVLVSLRSFLWLIYDDGNLIKVLSPNNLGDLSLHLSFIRYLAQTTHWWPVSPLLIHETLRYPIGSDLFNSLLLLVGMPIESGLIWTGLFGAAFTGMVLWRWGKAFGMAAFLFNGGLAGVVLWHGIDPEMQVQWKNLFLSMFVTQRGFLYALPVGLLLLSGWREEFFDGDQRVVSPSLPSWIQIILLGALPLFSPHSFLFLAAIMVSIIFFNTPVRKKLIMIALFAWPLGLLSMFIISPGGAAKNFMAWHLGWMQEGNGIYFWLWNFGISLPLIAVFSVVLFFRKDSGSKVARAFVLPSVIVFIVCLLLRVAPWPWDNMKLMIWSWLTIVPFLWSCFIKYGPYWLRCLLCVLLFASGTVTLFYGLNSSHGYEIAKRTEVDATRALFKNFSTDAVIATAPEYNHPVLLLGHPVVAGYEGHLWSHGLPYHERLAKLHSIMMGQKNWEAAAATLGVQAIYWSWREVNAFPHSKLPFAQQKKLPILINLKTAMDRGQM